MLAKHTVSLAARHEQGRRRSYTELVDGIERVGKVLYGGAGSVEFQRPLAGFFRVRERSLPCPSPVIVMGKVAGVEVERVSVQAFHGPGNRKMQSPALS